MANEKNFKDIDTEIKSLEKEKHRIKKAIESKTKNQYRKERARRLIETGALAEHYFEIESLSISEREEAFKKFARNHKAKLLIDTGALAEKYFEIQSLNVSEREELFRIFSDYIKENKPKKFKK